MHLVGDDVEKYAHLWTADQSVNEYDSIMGNMFLSIQTSNA